MLSVLQQDLEEEASTKDLEEVDFIVVISKNKKRK